MYGSHLEQRIFMTDIMAPLQRIGSQLPTISGVTLAVFVDSGWYEVERSNASPMIKGSR